MGWFVKYDSRFHGNASQAVAYFLGLGLDAEYARGIRDADSLDPPTRDALATSQARALRVKRDSD